MLQEELKVLLAVNHPQLYDQFARESGCELTPASDICYYDAVKGAVLEDKPDILVLSAYLYAAKDRPTEIINAIYAARENGVRVVFLAGSLDVEKNDDLLSKVVSLGVYDILFNPCPLTKIMEHIKKPAGFGDVSCYLKQPQLAKQAVLAQQPQVIDKGGGRLKLFTRPPPAVTSDIKKYEETINIESLPQTEVKATLIEQRITQPVTVPSAVLHTEKQVMAVAVCSPVPAGKTFVAVNLAAVAASCGENVALIDLDFTERAVYSWLNITACPTGVYDLLSGRPTAPAQASGISVYGADPIAIPQAHVDQPALIELLGKTAAGLVIFDMPRVLTEWHMEIVKDCGAVVMVADLDCHRYLKYSSYTDAFPDPVLVINKTAPLPWPLNYGIKPAAEVPISQDIYKSILLGRPLALQDASLRKPFEVLFRLIKQRRHHVIHARDVELPVSANS